MSDRASIQNDEIAVRQLHDSLKAMVGAIEGESPDTIEE